MIFLLVPPSHSTIAQKCQSTGTRQWKNPRQLFDSSASVLNCLTSDNKMYACTVHGKFSTPVGCQINVSNGCCRPLSNCDVRDVLNYFG